MATGTGDRPARGRGRGGRGGAPSVTNLEELRLAIRDVKGVSDTQACFDSAVRDGIQPDLQAYVALMKRYVKADDLTAVLKILSVLQEKGGELEPDMRVYNEVLACAAAADPPRLWSFWDTLRQKGLVPDTRTYEVVVGLCSSNGMYVDRAVPILRECLHENKVVLSATLANALLRCCTQLGYSKLAQKYYAQFSCDVPGFPTPYSYASMCHMLLNKKRLDEAKEFAMHAEDDHSPLSTDVLVRYHLAVGNVATASQKLDQRRTNGLCIYPNTWIRFLIGCHGSKNEQARAWAEDAANRVHRMDNHKRDIILGLIRDENYQVHRSWGPRVQSVGPPATEFRVKSVTPDVQNALDRFAAKTLESGHTPQLPAGDLMALLCGHAVRHAVASGLESSVPIIIKLIDLCSDCHAELALASKVYDREVRVLEPPYTHIMRNGRCLLCTEGDEDEV